MIIKMISLVMTLQLCLNGWWCYKQCKDGDGQLETYESIPTGTNHKIIGDFISNCS